MRMGWVFVPLRILIVELYRYQALRSSQKMGIGSLYDACTLEITGSRQASEGLPPCL
jgi:hypothetical protein